MKSKTVVWLGLACAALLLGGCPARQHLTASHGRSVAAAFMVQRVEHDPKKVSTAADGLDPLEAAMVAQGYHQSLAPAGTAPAQPQVMIVSPEKE